MDRTKEISINTIKWAGLINFDDLQTMMEEDNFQGIQTKINPQIIPGFIQGGWKIDEYNELKFFLL